MNVAYGNREGFGDPSEQRPIFGAKPLESPLELPGEVLNVLHAVLQLPGDKWRWSQTGRVVGMVLFPKSKANYSTTFHYIRRWIQD